jgi:hypothetical protein
MNRSRIFRRAWQIAAASLLTLPALAQGGPPLLTDDPGTPGNRNWEINVAYTQDRRADGNSYAVPILDVNYGVGDRIQLNFQIPYLYSTSDGSPRESGLGNSLVGVKWRFYQNEKAGWNISTYPHLELNNPTDSLRQGLVDRAPNFLLPVEVTKTLGPLELNLEAGYWFSQHLKDGHILGFAVGHQTTKKLELLSEVYDFGEVGNAVRDDTFDFGGRYEFHRGMLFLFMAGRSFQSPSSGQSQFIGYFGIQFQIQKTHQNPDPEASP